MAAGLHKYQQERLALLAWERLTLPEQDIVALACLGYNNREIAARLQKTRPSIANRLQRSYIKLGVKNRVELGALFIDWDFSPFGRASHQRAHLHLRQVQVSSTPAAHSSIRSAAEWYWLPVPAPLPKTSDSPVLNRQA